MGKKIEIVFDENGDPTVDGKGFTGPECDKFLNEITSALGSQVSAQKKPEYVARCSVKGRQAQRN